jgi:hypothetical protein
MCNMRSCAGPTGHPARYVAGTSAAVIASTVPVNGGGPGAAVVDAMLGGAVAAGFVVGGALVADVRVGVVDDDDAVLVARDPEPPHAPAASSIVSAGTPAHRGARTAS